jgi:hypothetical protein
MSCLSSFETILYSFNGATQLPEHLQAYHTKWLKFVNENISIAQVTAKIRSLKKKFWAPERSNEAPRLSHTNIPTSPPNFHTPNLRHPIPVIESHYKSIIYDLHPASTSFWDLETCESQFPGLLHGACGSGNSPTALAHNTAEERYSANGNHSADNEIDRFANSTLHTPNLPNPSHSQTPIPFEPRLGKKCKVAGQGGRVEGCARRRSAQHCRSMCAHCGQRECPGWNSKYPEKPCNVGWEYSRNIRQGA